MSSNYQAGEWRIPNPSPAPKGTYLNDPEPMAWYLVVTNGRLKVWISGETEAEVMKEAIEFCEWKNQRLKASDVSQPKSDNS